MYFHYYTVFVMTKEAEKFIAKQKESLIRINTAALNAIDKVSTAYNLTLFIFLTRPLPCRRQYFMC